MAALLQVRCVVDKKQAEYIQKRIGGTITCIPGVVPDDKPKAKGGRPIGSKPIKDMTAEELKAYNAAKSKL